MKKIITADGSATFYNPDYDDIYHSKSGALDESFGKFVKPCCIAELAGSQDSISILDVCFGLGYNSCAAMDAALKVNPQATFRIVGLEKRSNGTGFHRQSDLRVR